jgi:tetratricopeptide (TPR) repeat protein
LNSDDANGYYLRGFAYEESKKYQRAIADYDKAIQLNPNHVAAYYNRGTLYDQQSQYRLAIADYSQVISLVPNLASLYSAIYNVLPLVYKLRGCAYGYLDEYHNAIDDFDQVIKLDPNDAKIYAARGLLNISLGNLPSNSCNDFIKACQLGDCESYERARQKGYCH